MHPRGGWQIEFRDGPLAGQTKQVDTEPREEFEVPAEEGGPFTYVRISCEGVEESAEPMRLVYGPEEPIGPRHESWEETVARARHPDPRARRW